MQFGKLMISLFRTLPPRTREHLKLFLGAGGHTKSFVDSWRARQLAQWKHPDALFPIVEKIIKTTGKRSLDGAAVMEYGSGFLLAEPLIYSMFGAREVHAVDYLPLLQCEAFRAYARNFDWKPFIDSLVECRSRDNIDAWISSMQEAVRLPEAEWFNRIGIRYIAPFDILKDDAPSSSYDLIVSRSTLEHVPADLAQDIVARLVALVRPGGAMFHYIHLADHRDIDGGPYEFLAADDDYLPTQHDIRGNRMRASDWRAIFASHKNFQWTETTRADNAGLLPKNLGEPFRSYDHSDLLVNHFTMWGRRIDG